MLKAYMESDGRFHPDDYGSDYVIVPAKPGEIFGKRIDCPDSIFGNADRRKWARKKVAELNREDDSGC